ncbi:hypothetical protein GJAV_G00171120 [Gymnothorax javanicus]|nr:hypothetical protein GJAV_G00171120 [Gymnothorax javanicus]
MVSTRTLRIQPLMRTSAMYVVGTELNINLDSCAPPKCKYFTVQCSPNVQCEISPPGGNSSPLNPLTPNSALTITMAAPSEEADDGKVSVCFYSEPTEELGKAALNLTAVEVSLDVDADRDGVVEKNNPNKGSWKWGPQGHGAILLVNCDSESRYRSSPDHEHDDVRRVSDLKDMSRMIVRTKGPRSLPEGYELSLHVSQSDAEKIRIFRDGKQKGSTSFNYVYSYFVKSYPLVVDSENLCGVLPYERGTSEMDFYVEGLRFPDKDFEGLITINLSLVEHVAPSFPGTPIFTDKVVFHVAPWIMTPNTLDPVEVFMCRTGDNLPFMRGMKEIVERSGCKLTICPSSKNRGDRWMQDEMEFGYIEAPHHAFPVVLDSPRQGHLTDYSYDELLGPDFGFVTRSHANQWVTSLDSFGNLEVSPPVTVNGKSYPLGRIIIGVAFPTATRGRNMAKVVQDFLWAQKVQEPIALFSDWLVVGHVDEFMSFVPAPDRKGFRLLLASPDAAYRLFKTVQQNGHGQEKLFEEVKAKKAISVDDLLSDQILKDTNNYVQECIDWNRDVLKRELGLEEEDIIDVPILFELEEKHLVAAYYPDMVRHRLHTTHS